jgi:hypothetical protein
VRVGTAIDDDTTGTDVEDDADKDKDDEETRALLEEVLLEL